VVAGAALVLVVHWVGSDVSEHHLTLDVRDLALDLVKASGARRYVLSVAVERKQPAHEREQPLRTAARFIAHGVSLSGDTLHSYGLRRDDRCIGRRVPARDPSRMEVAKSRRSTPERLHQARLAAVVERLVGEGELRERATSVVSAWEDKADTEGLERDGRYCDVGWRWMTERRANRSSTGEPWFSGTIYVWPLLASARTLGRMNNYSRFTRHRLAWFVVGILTLAVPLVWPASFYIWWRLWSERHNVDAARQQRSATWPARRKVSAAFGASDPES
jgi:uncharacterized membrane protein